MKLKLTIIALTFQVGFHAFGDGNANSKNKIIGECSVQLPQFSDPTQCIDDTGQLTPKAVTPTMGEPPTVANANVACGHLPNNVNNLCGPATTIPSE